MLRFDLSIFCWGDSPQRMQISFQDPATNFMEGVFSFNVHLLTLIFGIIFIVGWLMISTLSTHLEIESSTLRPFYHSNVLEIIWIVVPACLLLELLSPSFSLLYSLKDPIDPCLKVKISGYQWHWSYEFTEATFCYLPEDIKYETYVLSDEWLRLDISGLKRTLEINRRVIFPYAKDILLKISGIDVLHSWTIPSFGIKVDACPGRVNLANLFIKRCGLFFGQCSEICGSNHGFMPISILVVPSESFKTVLTTYIKDITHL